MKKHLSTNTAFFIGLFCILQIPLFASSISDKKLTTHTFSDTIPPKEYLVNFKIKFCDSLVKHEHPWSISLIDEKGKYKKAYKMRGDFSTFKLSKGSYTLWTKGGHHHRPIKIDGPRNDTIKICKDYFLNKIINDTTLTIAEQVEIGDTFHFVFGYPGCAGPSQIDTIQIVRLQDKFAGKLKAWTKSAKTQTFTERQFELTQAEFNIFYRIEKECRLFKLSSGSCSASPIVYYFKVNDEGVGFGDNSCSKNSYGRFRNKLLEEEN